MKLEKILSLHSRLVLPAFLFLIFAFIGLANGQTSKKKKHKTPTPTPVVQTDLTVTDPTVVSRASDYQNQDVAVAVPQDVQPTSADTARDKQLASMSARIKQLESKVKDGYDDQQKRMLMNLDILTRAEQRSESLRKQRFDLMDKENQIQTRLDQIEIDIRPDSIERLVAMAGTLRPEELREARQKSLDSERKNLQALLTQVQSTRANLDDSVDKADQLVQKLRAKLETDIDKSIDDIKPDGQQ